MADQREITLYQGDASPKDIVLRALPVASVVETTIWLFQGDGTPKDIILRDPSATPSAGGAVTGTTTAGQGGQSVNAVAVFGVSGTATAGQGSQSANAVAAFGVSGTATAGQGGQSVAATGTFSLSVSGTASAGQGSQSADGDAEAEDDAPAPRFFGRLPRRRYVDYTEEDRKRHLDALKITHEDLGHKEPTRPKIEKAEPVEPKFGKTVADLAKLAEAPARKREILTVSRPEEDDTALRLLLLL